MEHLALVVGTAEGGPGCSGADGLQDAAGLRTGALRPSLEYLHQVGDEEVVLQGGHALLGQNGGLPAHGARQRQGLRGDVVL